MPSLFGNGKDASSINYDDEIDFWSRQLSEHALFMQLGLQDPALRVRANELHELWEQFRSVRPKMTTRDAAIQAVNLAMETRSLLLHVLDRLDKGQWLGWLWPLFVDHIRREGDYFIEQLQHKTFDVGDECQIWLQFMAEHAAFAAHLLDPTEAARIRDATAFIGNFEQLHNGCAAINPQLLDLTQKAGAELDQYFTSLPVGTPKLKSIIHPVLAAHVIREGQRFLEVVRRLKSETEF
jgi:hypothetical protein